MADNNLPCVPVIKENQPIPEPRGGRGSSRKWQFVYDLAVNQSAHMTFETTEQRNKYQNRLASVASRHGKIADKDFRVRRSEDGLSVGIWRTR